MENNLEMDMHGLVCDNPKCDWEDMSIKMEDYGQYVNMSCPKCSENILTEKDYNEVVELVKGVNLVNTMSPEMIESMVKGLSPEQMDQALDKMNSLGLTKVGEDEDGIQNWEYKHDKHKDTEEDG